MEIKSVKVLIATKQFLLITISVLWLGVANKIATFPRSRVFFKLTADQVLVFDWISGSCQVNLL